MQTAVPPHGCQDSPAVLELHRAALELFAGRPVGLDDDQADAWYNPALGRVRTAALATWGGGTP